MNRLGKYFLGVVSLGMLLNVTLANTGSMTLSPTTGSLGMRCIYPINFFVNVDDASVNAIDMRVLYSGDNMQFTGEGTGALSIGSYLVKTGTTITNISGYPIGSSYWLFNWASLIEPWTVNPLTGESSLFYSRYFQTTTNTLTGNLDFYFSGGWNGDDSNIQSGVANDFIDILSSVNSGYYNFIARPCILDTDPALFTGYASGEIVPYTDGISFTIYDFTGQHDFSTVGYDSLSGSTGDTYTLTGIYRYNNTVHYRWSGAIGNYDNYVPASDTSTGIDNQYGVNSGTITVSLSGTEFTSCAFTGDGIYSGGTLVNTSFNLSTWNNSDLFSCTGLEMSTSLDIGYPLTWDRNDRGYQCTLSSTGLVGHSGVWLDSCQTMIVTITGADNINFNNQINTGSISFSLTITGIDNTPPYIVSSLYIWSGAYNGGNTTGAGPVFSSGQIADWELWTKDNLEINLTGNKVIIMTNVVGWTGANLDNISISGGNGYSGINQTLLISGNVKSFVTFKDIANPGMDPNYGQTYATGSENYVYDFNIDVFWIDRITTELTGYLTYTGENGQLHYATLTLSGYATGNADSIKDDEFIIVAYSGIDGASNSPDVTEITGYTSTGYALYHSGIVFNDNWTGYVLYRDRADNTGQFYVNITGINKSFTYTIIAIPDNRLYSEGAQSGGIARFTFVSGYSSSSFTDWTGEVVFSGLVKTDGINGSYEFAFGFELGSGYTLIFEGQSDLSAVMTGIEITGSRVFDFTDGGGRLIPGDLITFQDGGIATASAKDGQVNGSDIGTMLAWFQVEYKVYSGGFHVWTGGVGKTEVLGGGSAWTPFAQYHPADLNGNGQIAVDDMQIQVANISKTSIRTRNDTLTFFDVFD